MTIDAIVRDYLRRFHRDAEFELRFYGELPRLEQAVICAARAVRPDGKRHDHQRKIPRAAMPQVFARLTSAHRQLRAATSFDELYTTIDALIRPIHGIGPLFVYDAALRIGAFLQLEPDAVYLHCGVTVGAVNLGFTRSRTRIEMRELPPGLRHLKPYQVEDILCIYKDALGRMKDRATAPITRGCSRASVATGC